MKLRILAPFRVHFALNNGMHAALSRDYIDFWTKTERRMKHGLSDQFLYLKQVRFMHSDTNINQDEIAYTSIEEDTMGHALEVMSIIPQNAEEMGKEAVVDAINSMKKDVTDKTDVDTLDFLSKICKPEMDRLKIKIYDHTIAILEMDIELRAIQDHLSVGYQRLLDYLQIFAVKFCDSFMGKFYPKALYPFLYHLSRIADKKAHYIQNPHHYESFHDLTIKDEKSPYLPRLRSPLFSGSESVQTKVMWITRTLMFEKTDKELVKSFTAHWLKDIGDKNEIEKVQSDPQAFSLAWVNYVVREGANDPAEQSPKVRRLTFREAWDSLTIAQYFYAALDCLNHNILDVIAVSYTKKVKRRIRELNYYLKSTISSAKLLIIHYREIKKYLTRNKLSMLEQIMKNWDFDNLIDYAEDKMALCSERLEDLHNVSMERSSLYTDILLLFIGAVSIIDLFLALSEYGRMLTGDALIGFRDDNIFGFLHRISMESTDSLLIYSTILIVVISILYYYFRRKSIL